MTGELTLTGPVLASGQDTVELGGSGQLERIVAVAEASPAGDEGSSPGGRGRWLRRWRRAKRGGGRRELALKVLREPEMVELGARREGGELLFTVTDRGCGVAPSETARIFDAFYRPAGVAPDDGHAGLGLSIARTLAELQGGTLTYETRDGGGSAFTLRLPAADVDEANADELTPT